MAKYTPETQNAVEALQMLCERYGIERVSSRLGYTYAYIHQVASGKLPMYSPMRRSVARAAQDEWGDFYTHRKTVTIRYEEHEEDMRQQHLTLSMDERKAALDAWRKEQI